MVYVLKSFSETDPAAYWCGLPDLSNGWDLELWLKPNEGKPTLIPDDIDPTRIANWMPRSYQVHKVVNPSADGPQPESEEQTVLLRRAEVDEWDDIEIYPPRTCSYDYVPLPEAPRHLRAD
jgi:hypothetical protein